ncbi:ADP-ribosylglycohydrolase family protein [Allokutzneria albata]|uniref:ADP-ribosylglycohydrolase n=1 Tax=Allokutzneria albata TaxID=211114 RepID=A0A1H0CVI8_ALLAB|nr:ADP-ribosylglycohydrolase family protein [Allokutzneria albata]SDN61890.1 ADP-ribosylglycohydrolase [Allokutzneria albata]
MTYTSDNGKRTTDSLDGLSVGDALGAQFFVPGSSVPDLLAGKAPPPPWLWTDDTEMACTLAAELRDHGSVQQDRLAMAFAERCEPYRGYGPGAVVILRRIREGEPWRTAAASAFDGQGSCGNGAAMRVAPLGAYFAGDPARAAREAELSAEVTHLHPEGIAGAVAVALAAAHAADPGITARDLLGAVLDQMAESQVRQGIAKAAGLFGCSTAEAAYQLGNGARATAQDTVPFTLWVAATHLDDYAAAITACVEAGGDVDTTGAIAGGVVATRSAIPQAWLAARESLPRW